MMLKKIKSLLKINTTKSVMKEEFYAIILEIVNEIKTNSEDSNFSIYKTKFSELESYKKLKKQKVSFKKDFTFWLVNDVVRIYKKNGSARIYNLKQEGNVFSVEQELLPLLFRSNLELEEADFIYYLNFFNSKNYIYKSIFTWPVGFLMQQLERKAKKEGINKELSTFLQKTLTWHQIEKNSNYHHESKTKLRNKIESILSLSDKKTIQKFIFNKDNFGNFANKELENQSEKEKEKLYQILSIAKKVNGGKPTQKYSKTTSLLLDDIDFTKYKNFIYQLLHKVIEIQPEEKTHYNTYNNEEYAYTTYEFIEKENLNTLKGLVWTLTKFHDKNTLITLAKLTVKCFKKIPGVGPTAGALGNACLYVLGNTKGREGVAQLTVLQNKIKQTSTKKLINKYITEVSEKLGISKSDIEESVVSEFNLTNGTKEILFEDYKLHISIEKIGKVKTLWIKPDGKTQKTQPSFIKNTKTLSEKLKKAKVEIKEIQKFTSAQRERLDRLFIEERIINHTNFKQYYLNHGLVSFLAKKLIWIITNSKNKEVGFYVDNKWVNVNHKEITWVNEDCSFQLWHPIYATTNEVLEWRIFLINLEITQPLKQAFRELYILTEAEINTKTYSNRMASHILKQHQFNMLAKIRDWNWTLIGYWDHGSDCIARRNIIVNNETFTIEFWLNEITADNLYNDTGILLYMSTDQVRYYKNEQQLDLIDMRDVDLFVGVASVGNDPEWSDNGGLPQYRDYWQSYSFGDLTEVAKTRKTILEGLIPRLKIKEVAKVEGKFLIIKGTLRTYKIHIGSTNILMTPNDQYLCIVPSGKKEVNDKVFLPFEGDKGLSIILSKAFLLAEDQKITDTTITSQINRS